LQMIGRHREAQGACQKALGILKKLAARFPQDSEIKLVMAKTYQRLGSLPSPGPDRRSPDPEGQRPPPPEETTLEALKLLEEPAASDSKNPAFRHLLALTYRDLADHHSRRRERSEADAVATKAIEILQQLAEEFPQVPAYRYDLIVVCTGKPQYRKMHYGQGRVFTDYVGNMSGKALELARELTSSHPSVPAYQWALGRCYLKLSDTLLSERRRGEAERNLSQAVAILDVLIRDYPLVSVYLRDYMLASQILADELRKRGQLSEALRMLQKNTASIEDALESGPQRRIEWVLLTRRYKELAKVLSELGEDQDAEEAFLRAEQIRRSQGPPARR
jgi:tetratricopeptide (TPR) repeat protein